MHKEYTRTVILGREEFLVR